MDFLQKLRMQMSLSLLSTLLQVRSLIISSELLRGTVYSEGKVQFV